MTTITRRRLAATIIAAILTAVPATAAPLTPAARDARIEALQAQLDGIAAELRDLRAAGSAAPARPPVAPETPGTAATSGSGVAFAPDVSVSAATAQSEPAAGRPRTFGEGVPSSAATARIDAGKPVITTADGRLTASLLAVMQFDVADYFQPAAGPLATDLRRGGAPGDTAHARNLQDGTTFRRARLGVAGHVFGDFDYTALFEFGGTGVEDSGHVQELWLQYSGLRPLHFRVGAFPPSLGLEDQGSTNGQPFLERPASADVARGLAGGDDREGGQVVANSDRVYAAAAITGRQVSTAGTAGVQPYDSQRGFTGRLAAVACRDAGTLVHLGAHGSYVDRPADTAGPNAAGLSALGAVELRERPELRVDGTRLIDTGAVPAAHAYTAGVEGAVQVRNLLLQGEYDRIGIDRGASTLRDPHFAGWYVEATWVVTGQRRRYNTGNFAFDGPAVTGGFNPLAGQWGAWELAARFSSLDLDDAAGSRGSAPFADAVRGGRQQIASAAVNWYLNAVARIMLQYQHVDIGRLSPDAATFQTAPGAFVGQRYSTAAARFQFAF